MSQAEGRTAPNWTGTKPAGLDGQPLIKSFAYNPKPHDRREALPSPLAVLAAWELYIVSLACAPAVGLLLGALLLCAHCSLRFGDIQRIKPSALSLSAQALRNLCWLPGQPVRASHLHVCPSVFKGRHQRILAGEVACPAPSVTRHSGRMGGFLRARLHSALRAKSQIQLASIGVPRWAIQLPWRSEGGQLVTSFTLHSLKCSL